MDPEIYLFLGQISLSLLHRKRNLQTDVRGPERETDKKAADIQARSCVARTLGEIGKKCPAEGEAKSGPMKSRNSIMQEKYEEFIPLTLRTRSSKKPLGMLERNPKH